MKSASFPPLQVSLIDFLSNVVIIEEPFCFCHNNEYLLVKGCKQRHFTLRFQRKCNLSGINCTDLIAISAVVCRFAAGKSSFTAFTADADYDECQ
ncbi:MAG: hypothetical protein LIO46_01730, partial [Clostridiales bacterium]|nr:hypothetical protein [Clostridiales bacterium]